MTPPADPEVTDLLQHLIRNQCVNDGTETSGHEIRSAELLTTVVEGPGVQVERFHGRRWSPGSRAATRPPRRCA